MFVVVTKMERWTVAFEPKAMTGLLPETAKSTSIFGSMAEFWACAAGTTARTSRDRRGSRRTMAKARTAWFIMLRARPSKKAPARQAASNRGGPLHWACGQFLLAFDKLHGRGAGRLDRMRLVAPLIALLLALPA